jgi:DNA-directed RNA polymerase subunit RPC12/RpoP
MKKYVDADIVNLKLKQICDNRNTSYGIQFGGRAKDFAQLTDDIPAADVVEDKSGAWENMNEIDSAYVNTYRCSACGTTFWIDESPEDANYNYCPNCGAKMGKGQEC